MKIALYIGLATLCFILGRMHAARATIETKRIVFAVVQTLVQATALAMTR